MTTWLDELEDTLSKKADAIFLAIERGITLRNAIATVGKARIPPNGRLVKWDPYGTAVLGQARRTLEDETAYSLHLFSDFWMV